MADSNHSGAAAKEAVELSYVQYEGTQEEPGDWYWFEGNFEAYEQNKVERLGPDALRTGRGVYRKLTRA